MRYLKISDARSLFSVFFHPDVMRHCNAPGWANILETFIAIDEDNSQSVGVGVLSLGIFLSDTQKLIGTIKLTAIPMEEKACRIGYALERNYWGHGYMAESIAALAAYAFESLDQSRIEAEVNYLNARSRKVLQNAGFAMKGLPRERAVDQENMSDFIVFELMRGDRGQVWRTVHMLVVTGGKDNVD